MSIETQIKRCTRCKVRRPLSDFNIETRNQIPRAECKLCGKERSRKSYGIDLPTKKFEKLLKKQNNCCAICGKHGDTTRKGLHVDHCHIKGFIRGLLCIHCNMGLGHFLDNPELLKKALSYLRRHNRLYNEKQRHIKSKQI